MAFVRGDCKRCLKKSVVLVQAPSVIGAKFYCQKCVDFMEECAEEELLSEWMLENKEPMDELAELEQQESIRKEKSNEQG